jgi:hypothetical protein
MTKQIDLPAIRERCKAIQARIADGPLGFATVNRTELDCLDLLALLDGSSAEPRAECRECGGSGKICSICGCTGNAAHAGDACHRWQSCTGCSSRPCVCDELQRAQNR